MGVYVHIPFCEQKCYYCDFHSVVVGDQGQFASVVSNYLSSLRQEALYYRAIWGHEPLTTLFIGGGTPSLVPPKELADFIQFLLGALPFSANPEITMEANPNSITLEGMQILAGAGVNRVSVGVQAFQNHLLNVIGRIHRAEQIAASVEAIREAGIGNINLDLMFGLPEQTSSDWLETLGLTVKLKPTHISCYGLILEPGTPFAAWKEAGLLDLPSDDFQAEMAEQARTFLTEAGYGHYEISNYCLPNMESKHNTLYWENVPFIGLGSGATGYVNQLRYTNKSSVGEYVTSWELGVPLYQTEDLVGVDQEMDETMMVGMRLLRGVAEATFKERFEVSFFDIYGHQIESLLKRGLVHFEAGHLRVTRQGLYLENQVSGIFLR